MLSCMIHYKVKVHVFVYLFLKCEDIFLKEKIKDLTSEERREIIVYFYTFRKEQFRKIERSLENCLLTYKRACPAPLPAPLSIAPISSFVPQAPSLPSVSPGKVSMAQTWLL